MPAHDRCSIMLILAGSQNVLGDDIPVQRLLKLHEKPRQSGRGGCYWM